MFGNKFLILTAVTAPFEPIIKVRAKKSEIIAYWRVPPNIAGGQPGGTKLSIAGTNPVLIEEWPEFIDKELGITTPCENFEPKNKKPDPITVTEVKDASVTDTKPAPTLRVVEAANEDKKETKNV